MSRWVVYRIEMPAATRAQYIERGSAEMRGMARLLVVIDDDACVEVGTFDDREKAEHAARVEFDRTNRACLVRSEVE